MEPEKFGAKGIFPTCHASVTPSKIARCDVLLKYVYIENVKWRC